MTNENDIEPDKTQSAFPSPPAAYTAQAYAHLEDYMGGRRKRVNAADRRRLIGTTMMLTPFFVSAGVLVSRMSVSQALWTIGVVVFLAVCFGGGFMVYRSGEKRDK